MRCLKCPRNYQAKQAAPLTFRDTHAYEYSLPYVIIAQQAVCLITVSLLAVRHGCLKLDAPEGHSLVGVLAGHQSGAQNPVLQQAGHGHPSDMSGTESRWGGHTPGEPQMQGCCQAREQGPEAMLGRPE